MTTSSRDTERDCNIPPVDIIENAFSLGFCICCDVDVVLDPCNEVVLERAFHELVQDVGRKKLVDVSSRKVVRERLSYTCLVHRIQVQIRMSHTVTSLTMPKTSQSVPGSSANVSQSLHVCARKRGIPSTSRSSGVAWHL